MGDIIETSLINGRPFQMMPILNLHRDVNKLRKIPGRSIGEDIMPYLNEIYFFITSTCSLKCQFCKHAYKQFVCCYKGRNTAEELSIQDIKSILDEAAGSSLTRINILGGNIFNYAEFKELLSLLTLFQKKIMLHSHYLNLLDCPSIPETIRGDSCEINLIVHFPVDDIKFENAMDFVEKKSLAPRFTFIIQSEEDLNMAITKNAMFGLKNVALKPLFNGSNIEFFEKFVFVKNKTEVFNSKPSLRDTHIRMAMNPSNFGKVYIKSNGNIHSNVTAAPLGKIGKTSLYDATYKEMLNGKSWRRLRSNVKPCKFCTLALLCPPLSNYEYVIGRNNLCHIQNFKRD